MLSLLLVGYLVHVLIYKTFRNESCAFLLQEIPYPLFIFSLCYICLYVSRGISLPIGEMCLKGYL